MSLACRIDVRRISIATGDPEQEFGHLRRASNPYSLAAFLKTKLADSLNEVSLSCRTKTLPPVISSEDWTCIQDTVSAIFQLEKIHPEQMNPVQNRIRAMTETGIGFIHDYYTKMILPKAMSLLMRPLKDNQNDVATCISDIWNNFYNKVLPAICWLFYDAEAKDNQSFRTITLEQFRDYILSVKQFEDYVKNHSKEKEFCSAVKQMVLILQTIPTMSLSFEKALQMEQLTSCVICPYLGQFGLYEQRGQPPTVKSNIPVGKDIKEETSSDESKSTVTSVTSPGSKTTIKKRLMLSKRQLSSGTLAPVFEQLPFYNSNKNNKNKSMPLSSNKNRVITVNSDSDESIETSGTPRFKIGRRHSLQPVSTYLGKAFS